MNHWIFSNPRTRIYV